MTQRGAVGIRVVQGHDLVMPTSSRMTAQMMMGSTVLQTN
jgi:hypothetical protein